MNLETIIECIYNTMSYYIYKISGNGMDYYGSSKQDFCERKAQHKTQFRYWKKMEGKSDCCISRLILEETEDWTMEKIEENIATEQEALERENWYINNYECININNALGLTGDDMREYKAKWARHNRLRTGETPLIPIPLKTEAEKKETRKIYTENLSPEQKEKIKAKQRENWANTEQTEEQKSVASARAKKQREDIKADPDKAAALKEYKKLKAAEYRADPAFVEKEKAQRNADPIKTAERLENNRLKMIEKRTDPAFVEKEKQQALARKNKSK